MNSEAICDELFGNLHAICQLPLDQQANYADHVIGKAVADHAVEFLRDQISQTEALPDKQYPRWNSCSVGGFAHIAVHCRDAELRSRAKVIWQEYMNWYQKQQ